MSFTDCLPLRVLTEPYGEIESPGYPSPYPTNIICSWTIAAPPGYTIKLTMYNVELGNCPEGCHACDYINIFDGNVQETSLGVFCDSNWARVWYSSGQNMSLTFISDGKNSSSSSGFYVYYSMNMNKKEKATSSKIY